LIARNYQKLDQVQNELKEEFKVQTVIIAFDFNKPFDDDIYEKLVREINEIEDIAILINNVGCLQGSNFHE
jgi:short-subunit dehydrogenase